MPAHKGGKKARKHGKGQRKAQRSRFGGYAGIFNHSQKMKEARMEARNRRLARRKVKRAANAAL